MKALLAGLGALVLAGFACQPALGQSNPWYPRVSYFYSPALLQPLRPAPDACNPGFYAYNYCGAPFGPNYCLYPPFPPVGTIPPCCPPDKIKAVAEGHLPPSAEVPGFMPGGQLPQWRPGMPWVPGMPGAPGMPHGPYPGVAPPGMAGPMGSPPLGEPRFGIPPGQGTPSFPTHPFARGPRDFFMWNEANEDQITRLRFPALVP